MTEGKTIYPFNMYLFQATYEWMLDVDLDPVLVFDERKMDVATRRFLYIGKTAVREAGFGARGFRCLTSRNGEIIDLLIEWSDIIGMVVGDEAYIEELRGVELIYWRDGEWYIVAPGLCPPSVFKRQRKIKIINKREHQQK